MRISLEPGRLKDKPTALISTCTHPMNELKGAGNQYRREIYCNLCKGRWSHLAPEELKSRKEAARSSANPVTIGPSRSYGPMEDGIKCLCGKPAHRWEVKKKGPTQGRHFFRCQSRVCDFFQWDPTEKSRRRTRRSSRADILKIQSQAEDHINQQGLEMQRAMKIQADQMEQSYRNQLEAQSSQHQQEMAEVKAQMAWMQGFLAQVQANQAAQTEGFSLVSDPSV